MKRLTPPLVIIGLSLLLALLSAALTYSTPSQAQIDFSDNAITLQVTPTPQQEDLSEIGSTDEIVIMGGVIAFIVLTPILLMRRYWR